MDAWVLHAEIPRAVERAARPLQQETLRWLDETTVCVALEAEPPSQVRRKVERRLGQPVELRLDCEVAHYPLGRGYVVLTVQPPAEILEETLDAMKPAYHEVIRPADPQMAVRVCMPKLAVADPVSLAEALKAHGIGVLAVYEVGGCRR